MKLCPFKLSEGNYAYMREDGSLEKGLFSYAGKFIGGFAKVEFKDGSTGYIDENMNTVNIDDVFLSKMTEIKKISYEEFKEILENNEDVMDKINFVLQQREEERLKKINEQGIEL